MLLDFLQKVFFKLDFIRKGSFLSLPNVIFKRLKKHSAIIINISS